MTTDIWVNGSFEDSGAWVSIRGVYHGGVISSLHVASGAAFGALTGSRLLALALGPALHLAGDRVPHRDLESRNVEVATGIAGAMLLGLRYGPAHPVTLGALAAAAPDLEHLSASLRPAGSKLFHGKRGWHREGPLGTRVQLSAAALVIGLLTVRGPRQR
jgi:hypothetical protein